MIVLVIVAIFGALFPISSPNIMAQEQSSSARAMIVIEQTTKRVLFQKNAFTPMAMASTTKIMTVLTALKLCSNLDELVQISPKAVGVPGTSIYLKKGEKLTVRELMYGIMLPSGNDASVALAIHAAGSEEKFVAEMNWLATRLGCEYTHFANPHGLDERGHFTTAHDLAIITAAAMEYPDFCEIAKTPSIQIAGSKEGTKRYLKNKNKLVGTMEHCTGVKIGFTDDAGRCLVASIERDGFKAISVVLNCGPMFEESRALLNYASNLFAMVNLSQLVKKTVPVTNSQTSFVTVACTNPCMYPLTKAEQEALEIVFDLPAELVAPLQVGQIAGKAKVLSDGRLLFEQDLTIMEEAKPIEKPNIAKEILQNWF